MLNNSTYVKILVFIFASFLLTNCDESSVNTNETKCYPLSRTDSSNYNEIYTYNSSKEIIKLERYNLSGANPENPFRTLEFTYDIIGNIELIKTYNSSGDLIENEYYEYNNQGALSFSTRVNISGDTIIQKQYYHNNMGFVYKIENYEFKNDERILKNTSSYEYDENANVTVEELSVRKNNVEFKDVFRYTYDENNNVFKNITAFDGIYIKHNTIKRNVERHNNDGSIIYQVYEYVYEYNSENYPISRVEFLDGEERNKEYYEYMCD